LGSQTAGIDLDAGPGGRALHGGQGIAQQAVAGRLDQPCVVGRPEDLVEAIARGIDLFDCVMPTRNGRNALVFTDRGPLRLRNALHQLDREPLDPACPCPACRHSRGYLRHLFQAGEMLGPILASIHNLTYYQRLLAETREAITADSFTEFREAKHRGWRTDA
jgi:queuine tRNA-ribosyltransferase